MRQIAEGPARTGNLVTTDRKLQRAGHQLSDGADLDSEHGRASTNVGRGAATRVFEGRIINVSLDRVTLPNGVDCELEIIHHPGGAAAVAIDDAKRVCLLRQYRYAVDGWLWELPAGKIDDHEPHLQTAQRELREEAGVLASTWSNLGDMVSSPGVFKERVYLYLAQGLKHVPAEREAEEVLEVHWIKWEQAINMALDNTISDAKTVIGLLRAQARLADA